MKLAAEGFYDIWLCVVTLLSVRTGIYVRGKGRGEGDEK